MIQSLCESCSDNMFLYRDSGGEVSEVHYFDMESHSHALKNHIDSRGHQ